MTKERASITFSQSSRVIEKSSDIDFTKYSKVDEEWIRDVLPEVKESGKFVEIIPLYVTTSRNKRKYSELAVKTFADLCVGVEAYLGHDDSWQPTPYRTPVGKFIASSFENVTVKGAQVKGVKALCYISSIEEGKTLFTTIKEKTAGNVSLDGYVVSKYNEKDNVYEVERFASVNSIDFVNNRTESVVSAGVTGVVKESFKCDDEPNTRGNAKMDITLEKLKESADGREIIKSVEAAATAPVVKALSEAKTEIDTLKESLKSLETKLAENSKKAEEMTSALLGKTLEAYKAELVDAAKASEKALADKDGRDPSYKAIELASKKLTAKVLEKSRIANDDVTFTKSKASLKESFDAELAAILEIFEMVGTPSASGTTTVEEKTTVASAGSSGGRGQVSVSLSDIFPDAPKKDK